MPLKLDCNPLFLFYSKLEGKLVGIDIRLNISKILLDILDFLNSVLISTVTCPMLLFSITVADLNKSIKLLCLVQIGYYCYLSYEAMHYYK